MPGRHKWLGALALVALSVHIAGALGISLTGELGWARYLVAILGVVAVPLCAWVVARTLDELCKQQLQRWLALVLRPGFGLAFVAIVPATFRLLREQPLPIISHYIGLGSAVASIFVLSGLVLLGIGVADIIYMLTSQFRHLSTRLMLLVLATAFCIFAWLSIIGIQLRALVRWAVEEGDLQGYLDWLESLTSSAGAYLGGLAGAIALLLPFLLILAWRFGANATQGLAVLRQGFERVSKGNYELPVVVTGNDEIGEMQRGFNAMLEAARERRFLEATFGQYVSPIVLERIRDQGTGGRLAGERREATVMFSDIRGFTAMSAAVAPEDLIAVINDYMALMIDTLAAYNGYINKFVGDAIMVVFNVPLEQPDHAVRAVACGNAMQVELARANATEGFGSLGPLHMGVGINSGPLVAGNVGNERQTEYTVIGDTVNVASRACSYAEPGQVLLTRNTLLSLRDGAEARGLKLESASAGQFAVKGKGEMEFFYLNDAKILDALLHK